jgi:hypothetical protein
MYRKLASISAAAAICIAAQPAAAAYDKLPRALAALPPSHFAGSVRVETDPAERFVVLSTDKGYERVRAIKGALADDVHLRARIDRGTGQVQWQVWHDLAYVGGARDIYVVRYFAHGGPREAKPLSLDHRPDRCPPTDGLGSCGQASRIAFELPEETIREIAKRHGTRTPWQLEFKDVQGKDISGGLAPAEAAGLLQAVEEWRRSGPRRGLPEA